MKISVLLTLLCLLPIVSAQCFDPQTTPEIAGDTTFCSETYVLEIPITVQGKGLSIDCNSAVLSCASPLTNAVEVIDVENVIVRNCVIKNCQNGLYLKNVIDVGVIDSILVDNKIGVAVEDSEMLLLQNNTFENNSNSFYSIRSDIDEEALVALNSFDKLPVIQQSVTEPEEAVESVNITPEPKELLEQREVITIEIDQEAMSKILKDIINARNPLLATQQVDEKVDELVVKYFEISKQSLALKRTIIYNGSETLVTIEITPKQRLTNVTYYESIPKCVAEYVAEILFLTKNYDVIKDDPLLVWSFTNVEGRTAISYVVKKKIPDDCLKLLAGMGIVVPEEQVVQTKEKWRVYVAILFIPLIALIIIYFSRFRPKTESCS